jgi:hypothetical protein
MMNVTLGYSDKYELRVAKLSLRGRSARIASSWAIGAVRAPNDKGP